MARLLSIHSQNPQSRLIQQVTEVLHSGGVIAYPTDSGYALGCLLDNKNGWQRIRTIRSLNKHHHFTLMLRNLVHISEYARLDNTAFRLLKKILPGAYTFILQGRKDVPKRLLHATTKTIGVRISQHSLVQTLLAQLNEPLMSVSLIITGYEFYNSTDVKTALNTVVDLVIDFGHCPPEPTTVIDLSTDKIHIIRQGQGDTSFLI